MDFMRGMARWGLLARGVLYGVVGVIAVQVALGKGGEEADKEGALEAIGARPLGRILLLLVAVGFVGYALWRFTQALVDPEDKGDDAPGLAKRCWYVVLGLFYLTLTYSSARLAVDAGHESGGAERSGGLLSYPLGRPAVLAAGVWLGAAGILDLWRCVSRSFTETLETAGMSEAAEKATTALGMVGLAARGVAKFVVGFFLARAAWQYDPSEPAGLDASLREVARQPWGPPVLIGIALGLVAFGLFSAVQARFLRVLE